jgi:FlaA1/EpsC-like NDP-sugar epimerase
MCIDALSLLFAIALSFTLRFDDLQWAAIYKHYLSQHMMSLPIVIALYLGIFLWFRLYHYAWRFASVEMVKAIVYANTLGVVGLIITQFLIDGLPFPRSVTIIFWVSGVVLVGGSRVLLRSYSIARHNGKLSVRETARPVPPKRVVILGAGASGARVLRAIGDDPETPYRVLGFLDDDPHKNGKYIHNVKVLGPMKLLGSLLSDHMVDEVIVALRETGTQHIRAHILQCRKHKIAVKVVPNLQDLLTSQAALELADFGVEDLLRRPTVDTQVTGMGDYLRGKRVLITGAGGSIGSELCRQVLSFNPSALILLGHGENSIHQIHQDLRRVYPDKMDRVRCTIVSVSNEARVRQEIMRSHPQIVFHAAAHKHVPVMETNEQEAVHNNVLGTAYVARACGRIGVERFVLISTDKAADPCSVMGATKWLCEEVTRAMAAHWPKTEYVAVRFGNVLGSRGSVVPIFREQIKYGGPVTVTHPDMTRYFMTIPEAVRLVLQAGGLGRSGELYLLDMGKPTKIVDLAEDMIRLCGLEPGVDIKVRFTGVRPGERLHEQLISSDEEIKQTPWDGLLLIKRPRYYTPVQVAKVLHRLENAVRFGRGQDIRRLLHKLVNCPSQMPICSSALVSSSSTHSGW